MTRSLIVGVDDTDDSRKALARAAELARAAGLGLVVVHVRHIPVFAEMSSMTIGPARQNLDLIEAEARRGSEEVLQGTGVDWSPLSSPSPPQQWRRTQPPPQRWWRPRTMRTPLTGGSAPPLRCRSISLLRESPRARARSSTQRRW
jgi:Universal stress protein family